MRKVAELSCPEIATLQNMMKYHPLTWSRIRANAIILSHENVPLQTIAQINNVCRQTVSIWLNSWEEKGLVGLIDRPGRGRKKTLSQEQEQTVIKNVKKNRAH